MVKGTHQALDDVRNEKVKIFINGEFFLRDEAKISVYDSGYLVGDGVWEAFRVHNGKLIFIDQHLDRLWQSAKVIGISLPFSREELIENVKSTLEINEMKDHIHVRAMVTRGIKKTPSQDPRLTISGPNVVIIAEHKQAADESKNKGISLFTSAIRRGSPDYLDPRLNCHSKLHEVQALIQAIEAGADEALMLDINGFVSTCNATNFFMVKGNEVWTSTGEYCMNGITRGNVIKVCAQNGIVCLQKNFSLFDVYGADEAFVTGTFGGLTPVVKIDGKSIGPGACGPTTAHLRQLYEGLVAKQLR
ncbi:aminotransferase class IV [Cyclobacterium amurskyense]|uniref:branched-chain-amino-acid transaminase n=1 Tax=Cyclobacterium amurskyense TaxID=320787 RepID=A0A0H4P6G9_9BACT|nr:aminotransferase class IV [Cyclobacterium amurskyense]AKP49739.1 Branched-chain amino acid aminotransferase [Cyclobacterium amurskyense]